MNAEDKIIKDKYEQLLKWLDNNPHTSTHEFAQTISAVSQIRSIKESQETQFWIKWATIVMSLTSLVNLAILLK